MTSPYPKKCSRREQSEEAQSHLEDIMPEEIEELFELDVVQEHIKTRRLTGKGKTNDE